MRRGITNKFNRGELDSRALLRDDVEKVTDSCALMTNLMPQRLGPMQFRPGTQFISTIGGDNYLVPFVARTDDYAIVSFEIDKATIWVDDALVDQPTGSLTLDNQFFNTDITFWSDDSGPGSLASWHASGAAELTGFETSSAKLWQTMSGLLSNTEHCLRIEVLETPILLRIGLNGVDSDEIFTGFLNPGTHFLNFEVTGTPPTITMSNSQKYKALVSQVSIGTGATLELPLPDDIGELNSIRYAHSADVLFCATSDTRMFVIERRGKKSWSVVDYRSDDGPFGLINNTDITLSTNKLDGNANITASDAVFKDTDVGRLLKMSSSSQIVKSDVNNDNAGTDGIRVAGVGPVRKFLIQTSGGSGTVTLQRSVDNNSWEDVESYTSGHVKHYNDDLDNSTLFYRLHVEPGDYISGTLTLTLTYESGSIDGFARIIRFIDSKKVGTQVLRALGDFNETEDWTITEWGARGAYPSAVTLYEGRLWWAGKNKLYGSVSDEYASFDDELEGDSSPIRRTIGFGPVDRVDWLAPSSRLIMGVASDEISVRSSSFGTVLSQTNCNLKSGSTQGVAPIEPLKVDDKLLFVQRSGVKIMDTGYVADNDAQATVDLMNLHPRICLPGIVRMAAARQPETRIYIVLADGTMRVHLEDPAEDVAAWSRISTDGLFKDVVVLPGPAEDQVYVVVERGGVRFLEKFSQLEAMVDEHFDSSILYDNPGSGVLTGLDHLEGETVGVWADGKDRGTFIVAAGSIDVVATYADVSVGLPYIAQYKSNKLSAYWSTPSGKSRVQGKVKRVVDFHLAMENYWPGAIMTGPEFTDLQPLPEIEFGKLLPTDELVEEYDERPFEFNGNADVDSRICMQLTGPATILAISYGVLTEDDTE